jgi:hypothetical protein
MRLHETSRDFKRLYETSWDFQDFTAEVSLFPPWETYRYQLITRKN